MMMGSTLSGVGSSAKAAKAVILMWTTLFLLLTALSFSTTNDKHGRSLEDTGEEYVPPTTTNNTNNTNTGYVPVDDDVSNDDGGEEWFGIDDDRFSESIQFEQCITLENDDTTVPITTSKQRNHNNNNADSFQPKYLVNFSSFSQPNQCYGQQDDQDIQYHLVDLETYLKKVAEQRFTFRDVLCITCKDTCRDSFNTNQNNTTRNNTTRHFQRKLEEENEEEEEGEELCSFCVELCKEIDAISDGSGNIDLLESSEFIECRPLDNIANNGDDGLFLFGGPYCSEDGSKIEIGVFTDESCTNRAKDLRIEDVLFNQGIKLVKLNLDVVASIVNRPCTSCDAYTDQDFEFLVDLTNSRQEYLPLVSAHYEMCSDLFLAAYNFQNNQDQDTYKYTESIQLQKCNTELVPITVASSRSSSSSSATAIMASKHFATISVKQYCDTIGQEGGWFQTRKLEEPNFEEETFVVELETYLEHIVTYRKVVNERTCNICSDICNVNHQEWPGGRFLEDVGEEEFLEFSCQWCEKRCVGESMTPSYVNDATSFIKCTMIYSPEDNDVENPLYAGPVCGTGGGSSAIIDIAVFTDKDCTVMDPTKHPRDYLDGSSADLDYSLLETTHGDNSCTSCIGSDVYYLGLLDVDRVNDAQTMCTNLFEAGEQFEMNLLAETPSPSASPSIDSTSPPTPPASSAETTSLAALSVLLFTVVITMMWY